MTLIFSLVWRYSVAEMYILGISSETLLPSNLTETIKDGVVSSKEFAQSFTGMECVCTDTSYEESSIFVAQEQWLQIEKSIRNFYENFK